MTSNSVWLIAAKWLVAIVAAQWLGLSEAFRILLCVMSLDMLSGVVAGIANKDLSASVGAKGIAKKAAILLIVGTVHVASDWLGDHIAFPVDGAPILAGFYILTEIISVIENCARAGAPVPVWLVNILRTAQKLQQEQAMAEVKETQQAAVESAKQAQKATEKLVDVVEKPTPVIPITTQTGTGDGKG